MEPEDGQDGANQTSDERIVAAQVRQFMRQNSL